MKRLAVILVTVVALMGFMTAGSALATTYNGALWDPTGPGGDVNWNTNANNPSLPAPAAAATATFTVESIDFSSGSPETYGDWLSGVANVNVFAPGSQPSPGWIAGTNFYSPSTNVSPYSGTFFQFTWAETFSTDVILTVTLTHDDGVYLMVDGVAFMDYSTPDTVKTQTNSITLSAGLHNFVLNYGGVNGFPEVLQYSASTEAVPVPPSTLLLGTGLLGLVGLGYRSRRKS
jgi:hypothetical protein